MMPETLDKLDSKILGQLMLMQSVVLNLPNESSITGFICKGLLDVPGIKKATYSNDNKQVSENERNNINFPIHVGDSFYGNISLVLSDINKFQPYKDYLSNLMFMVGVILEQKHQRKVIEKHQAKLKQEVKNRTEQLKNEKQLLQSIIDNIPVMITIYDSEVNTIILNKATENITGWTNEDVQKTNIMELAYPNPDYRKEVADFMKALQPEFRDLFMRTKDGRDIETSWANVSIPDGRSVGVGVDISERKKLEKELVKAREKAEKENYIQYKFIQNISHEVRTPMNSILGFSELLKNLVKNEKEKEFLSAITYNGNQLLRLIDDILDFSRLDKNELSLSKKIVNLKSVTDEINTQLKGLKNVYKKKHLKTTINIPDNAAEIVINTDVNRLHQIITNLLSNAIKYTEQGSVNFGCELQKNELLFYVKDTGVGIHREDHERVFQRFNRFYNSNKKELRGTGLGLAICKHLVKLLDGNIWFESAGGKGTAFYFTHPVEKVSVAEEKSNDVEEKNHKAPDLKGKTILIAEDDSFSYTMMLYMLEATGATILHAETGTEALKLTRENEIDLLFLDIRLPEMNGFQVIKELGKNNINIPVIAQTASALEEDKQEIKRYGFNYHATKPLSQNELFGILNKFLS